MRIIITFIFSIFIMYISLSSITAEEIAPYYDLPACINMALKNSRKIMIDQKKIIEAQEKIEEVKSAFYPNVSANLLFTRLEKAPTINNIKIGDVNTYNLKLQVSYPLYTAGATKIGSEIAELGLKTNEIKSNITNIEIAYSVYQGYFNVLKANKFADVAKESIKLLKAHEKNVQNLYLSEVVTKSDLLAIQVKLAESEQLLIKAKNGVKITETAFNQILGRKMDSSIILKDYKDFINFGKKYEDCLQTAYNNSKELKSMELLVQINEKKKALDAAENKPKVSLNGAYNIDEGGLSSDKKWSVSLNAAIPIWDHDRIKHKTSQDSAQIEQLRLQILELREIIALQINQAFINVESAKNEIETIKVAINLAQENFALARKRYESNLALNTEVMDAETALTRVNINYFSALYDYQLAIAALNKAMGTLGE
ncbi:TolC family protein [Candidatus Poribacteria bacterium]|nr:TolC family protein [Candidatus Poribacteria bacterium]